MFFNVRKSLIARSVLILALLSAMFGIMSASVHAATLMVTNTNDSGEGSLREAVINAIPGDTIIFDPSLAGQTIVLASQIDLDKDLTIDASGLDPSVEISGSLASRIFYVSPNSVVTLKSLLLKNGRSDLASGGAIYSEGSLAVSDSTFINNATTNNGGAIYSIFTLNISNSTFVGNSAHSGGAIYFAGGIFSNPNSRRTIVNSTFVSNRANAVNGQGGGIFNYGSGDFSGWESVLFLANNTFSENGAYNGGGLYNWGSLTFNNNIFANSTSGGDCVVDAIGGMSTASNNLIEDGFSCSSGSSISGDPLLAPLSDNGGSTLTMALLPGSPAIDAGTATCLPTDQRGVTRPQGAACEIGAYEYEYQSLVRYVKSDASGVNNGSSWTDAYTDLQNALAGASSGDEIWVAAGIYKPDTSTDRTVSFTLKNGVAIYGGFTGIETLRTQRDPAVNLTVLSGDLGVLGDNSDNSYHVVVGSNTNNYAKLDGFTVTAGNANDSSHPDDKGGGMYNDTGNPTLTNIVFSGNSAIFGGGIYNDGMIGGWKGSNPILTNVTFSSNSAIEGGGMENMNYSNPRLMNVTFSGNAAIRSGGGMINFNSSNPFLTNVTFNGNTAFAGGGVMNWNNSHPFLINTTFSANSATDSGGGIYNDYGSTPTITNSILYGNSGGEIYDVSGTASVTYSIVQGGYPGTGNLDVDPLLGPLQDNGGFTQTLALGVGSPAIDAGDDVDCPATDQRGVARPQGSHCDIGAYEYIQIPPTLTPTSTPTDTPTPTPTITVTPTQTPKHGKPPARTKTPAPTRTPK